MAVTKRESVLWAIVIYFSITGFGPANRLAGGKITKWVISKSSNLSVNGSTNVNKFSCVIPTYDKVDTLTLREGNTGKKVLLSGSIELNVNTFDCHNSGMTKQLRKTLGEKEFPLLRIRFLSLSDKPVLSSTPEAITGFVEIEIAGVTKRVPVSYQVMQDGQKTIRLLGTQNVNFSDFNLVPPRKLGGMIKTKDQLSVIFTLLMKAMD